MNLIRWWQRSFVLTVMIEILLTQKLDVDVSTEKWSAAGCRYALISYQIVIPSNLSLRNAVRLCTLHGHGTFFIFFFIFLLPLSILLFSVCTVRPLTFLFLRHTVSPCPSPEKCNHPPLSAVQHIFHFPHSLYSSGLLSQSNLSLAIHQSLFSWTSSTDFRDFGNPMAAVDEHCWVSGKRMSAEFCWRFSRTIRSL